MTKKTKKRKGFTKHKNAPKIVKGFIGQRFRVVGTEVETLNIASIGDLAVNVKKTRHGGRRIHLINPATLFATRAAAIASLQPINGYTLSWGGKLMPVSSTGPEGDRTLYRRGKNPDRVNGQFFPTKVAALKHLWKKEEAKLLESKKETAKIAAGSVVAHSRYVKACRAAGVRP